MMPTVWNLRGSVICGLALGLLFTASPLFTVTLAGAAVLLAASGRGLDAGERRRLMVLLACALAARFAWIGVVLVGGIPYLNDLSVGALRGDDAYYLGRAIRARDIAVGITAGKYDFFVVTDEYGRTSYLQLLTVFQVLFGPTPYGMRAFNALLYVTGAVIVFRMARRGFGEWPAFLGLAVLLFLPSLFVSSVSLLKEPAYFLTTAVVLWCANAMLRRPSWRKAAIALALGAVCLFVLEDLRRGALVLAVAGMATAVVMMLVFTSARRAAAAAALAVLVIAVAWTQEPVRARAVSAVTSAAKMHGGHVFTTARRAAAAAALAVLVIAVAWTQEPLRARAVSAITSAAKMHGGHVFTVGHAYKLLDDGFYMRPGTPAAWGIELTDAQALRFLVRAAISFIVTPLPWEMVSRSELVFFPEHVLWWLIVACVPIGCVAGWTRDRTITALFLGFALPTAAALAVTNGNVGTLLRLRGLVTPMLIWLAALGALAVLESLLRGSRSVVLLPKEAR